MPRGAATDRLRRKIEIERTVYWWGRTYRVTPRFVAAKLGNGKRLLWFQPLNTRPDYYVVRVDSSWVGDKMYDRIYEVIDAIEEEYSEKEREREYLEEDLVAQGIEPTGDNTDLAGNEDRLGWPVLSLDSGYGWGEEDWPDRRSE